MILAGSSSEAYEDFEEDTVRIETSRPLLLQILPTHDIFSR